MSRENTPTAEEAKRDKNLELAYMQEKRWKAREYDHRPEEKALEIAQSYNGRDVADAELKEWEGKVGIFKGYIINALLHKLGYSNYEDNARRPNKIVYTRKAVCPFCKKVIHGYSKDND